MRKYTCPCCGYHTFKEPLEGYYNICDICYWIDDMEQQKNPTNVNGANELSLQESIYNFIKYGVGDIKYKNYIRKALDNEVPEWIIVIDKKDYQLISKYIDEEDMNFLSANNLIKFDCNENLLIDFRNDGDLIFYDLVCDLYTKVGIYKDEPTDLGYTIEGISDYIYSCMDAIEEVNRLRITQNYEEWLILQEQRFGKGVYRDGWDLYKLAAYRKEK